MHWVANSSYFFKKSLRIIFSINTGKSQFKEPKFSFLKSNHISSKNDLCTEKKGGPKSVVCRWICNLRSFLNQYSIVESFPSRWWPLKNMSIWWAKPFLKSVSCRCTCAIITCKKYFENCMWHVFRCDSKFAHVCTFFPNLLFDDIFKTFLVG